MARCPLREFPPHCPAGSYESEDGLEDISNWVVSQGRKGYEAVLADPSLMPAEVEVDDPTILFPVAFDVYWDRFGEDLDVM